MSYIDPDEVERAYRAMAEKSLDAAFAGPAHAGDAELRRLFSSFIDTQVAFQRFLAGCQNGNADARAVGFVVGMGMDTMISALMANCREPGRAEQGLRSGFIQAARMDPAEDVVGPVRMHA